MTTCSLALLAIQVLNRIDTVIKNHTLFTLKRHIVVVSSSAYVCSFLANDSDNYTMTNYFDHLLCCNQRMIIAN